MLVLLKKASDSVWQSELIYKLHKYGIREKFFKVIKSMYSAIKSCVKIDKNATTDMFFVTKEYDKLMA